MDQLLQKKNDNFQKYMQSYAQGSVFVDHAPLELFFESSNVCNINCIMCAKGALNNWPKNDHFVTTELIQKVEPFLQTALMAHLHGFGEPLTNKQLLPIIKMLRERGGSTQIDFFTNGMLLTKEKAEACVDLEVNRITFSIDGATAQTYEKIISGAKFDLLQNNLQNLKNFKRIMGSDKPKLEINFIAMNQNFGELPDLVKFAYKYNISKIDVKVLITYESIPEMNDQRRIYDPDQDGKILDETNKLAGELGVEISMGQYLESRKTQAEAGTDLQDDVHLPSQRYETLQMMQRRVCFQPWKTLYVKPNGDVRPCCFSGDTVLGNLFEQPIAAIWNGAGFKRFRENIWHNNYPKECEHCIKWNLRPKSDDSQYFLSVMKYESTKTAPPLKSTLPNSLSQGNTLDDQVINLAKPIGWSDRCIPDDDGIYFDGWAFETQKEYIPEWILVTQQGTILDVIPHNAVLREDVANSIGPKSLYSGYKFYVSKERFNDVKEINGIQLYAVLPDRTICKIAQSKVLNEHVDVDDKEISSTSDILPTQYDKVASILKKVDDLVAAKDFPTAYAALEQILFILPDDPFLLVTKGNLLVQMGDIDGARRTLTQATSSNPEYALAHGYLGAVLASQELYPEAEFYLRRAIELDPQNAVADKLLNSLPKQKNEMHSEAKNSNNESDSTNQNETEFSTIKANAPADHNQLLPDTLELNKKINELVLLADQAVKEGDWEQGYELLTKASLLEPDNPGIITGMGTCLLHKGNPLKALSLFRKVSILSPESPEAFNNLGVTYQFINAPFDAEEAFTQAISLDQTNLQAQKNLAFCYLQQDKRREDGINALISLSKNYPNDVDILVMLAGVDENTGNVKSAMEMYRKVLNLVPDNPTALSGLRRLENQNILSSINAPVDQQVNASDLQKAQKAWDSMNIDMTRSVAWLSIKMIDDYYHSHCLVNGITFHDLLSHQFGGKTQLVGAALACGDMKYESANFDGNNFTFATVHGFDISSESIKRFDKSKHQFTFVPHIIDVNLLTLSEESYDLVIGNHGIHHIYNLENLFTQAANALNMDGFLKIDEWIGPDYLQIPLSNHIISALLLWLLFPNAKKRTNHMGKVKGWWVQDPKEAFDPSEACNSVRLLPELRKHFKPVKEFLFGGLLYPMFEGIAPNMDENKPCDHWRIKLAIFLEFYLTKLGLVKPLFISGIYKKKQS
jgi:radical SAM protein with 4Fe4S-binding SPASM domain